MNNGWLVNDTLTCIPNTKTFWHFLLESLESLQDKTNGYTDFNYLPYKIEYEYQKSEIKPDYIIRNATFFRKLKLPVRTISLLQDPFEKNSNIWLQQIEVCNSSNVVVYNSEYTKMLYSPYISSKSVTIPIGTDSDLFHDKKYIKNKNTIIYVGSSDEQYKGFSMILDIIKNTNYNFILVMKDNFHIDHPRVKVFNKIDQKQLVELLNISDVLVCSSKKETLHLAGIEAAFCNVPIVSSDTGIYSSIKNLTGWGTVVEKYTLEEYIRCIKKVLNETSLKPREIMLQYGLSIESCKKNWKELIMDKK